jgi:ribosome biogenesis GTPase A
MEAVDVASSRTGVTRGSLLDPTIQALRNDLAETLCGLETLAEQCGDAEDRRLARDTLGAVNGPFRFVILGEVKSGKSSFVNALLGEEICRVAPEPCTDSIQEIVYSAEEGVDILGPNRKRIRRPIELLKTIAVVDTPGANSVVRDHEIITREYIPHSDLVLFVLPARNPHTQSAWDLLEYVREEWSRKVMFVLQQKDLEEEHLEVQLRSVRDYAVKAGMRNPVIFATSARWEQQGRREDSGMAEVRRYIRASITGGRHMAQKLDGQASTGAKALAKIRARLDEAKQKLDHDRAFRQRVGARLGRGRDRSTKEIDDLVARLLDAYDAITADFKEEFRQGMGVWPVVRRSFPGGESNREWLEALRVRFEETLSKKINRVAGEEAQRFIEAIKTLLLELLEETQRDSSPAATAGTLGKMEDQRREILQGISAELEELAKDQEPLHRGLGEASKQVGQVAMGGGLLTGIGAVIATTTKLAIFDITGGVLAAAGLLLAGFALVWKRGKIVDEFADSLKRARSQFERELRDRLNADLRGIYDVIDAKFSALDLIIEEQEKHLPPKLELADKVSAGLEQVRNRAEGIAESM